MAISALVQGEGKGKGVGGITERGLPEVGGFIALGLVNIIRHGDELGVR